MIIDRVLLLPRLIRIFIVAFATLLLVMAIFPLVDIVYVTYFFTPGTVVLPSLISVSLGLVVYVWGWRSLVGLVGESPAPKLSSRAFIVLALLLLFFDLVLILQGLAMTYWIAG